MTKIVYLVPDTEPIPDPVTCAPCGQFVRRGVPWHLSASESNGGDHTIRMLQTGKDAPFLVDQHTVYMKKSSLLVQPGLDHFNSSNWDVDFVGNTNTDNYYFFYSYIPANHPLLTAGTISIDLEGLNRAVVAGQASWAFSSIHGVTGKYIEVDIGIWEESPGVNVLWFSVATKVNDDDAIDHLFDNVTFKLDGVATYQFSLQLTNYNANSTLYLSDYLTHVPSSYDFTTNLRIQLVNKAGFDALFDSSAQGIHPEVFSVSSE